METVYTDRKSQEILAMLVLEILQGRIKLKVNRDILWEILINLLWLFLLV